MVESVQAPTKFNIAMKECNQEVFKFQAQGSRKVTADFSGGHLSSDGGLVFIREAENKRGILGKHAVDSSLAA